jgi:cytochrome c553
MGNESFYLVIGIVGFMFGLVSYTHSNLEYTGYERVQNCTGECYEKYVAENGTPAEIERKKQAAAADDPFSSIKGLWAGCAACHGQSGQGMGIFPKLAGQDADTIIEKLTIYKNRGEVGNMSSTMWAQAGQLSEQEIETLGNFIQETMNE